MKAFAALLGLSFKKLLLNSVNIGRGAKRKGRSFTGVSALLFLSALMVYFSATQSFALGGLFAAMGGLDVLMMAMMLASVAFPFIFVVFGSQSLLFSSPDSFQENGEFEIK